MRRAGGNRPPHARRVPVPTRDDADGGRAGDDDGRGAGLPQVWAWVWADGRGPRGRVAPPTHQRRDRPTGWVSVRGDNTDRDVSRTLQADGRPRAGARANGGVAGGGRRGQRGVSAERPVTNRDGRRARATNDAPAEDLPIVQAAIKWHPLQPYLSEL